MPRRTPSLVRLPLLAALALAILCGVGSTAGAQPKAPLTTIRVGAIQSLGYMPFYVALDKGYFVKRGIRIDLQNIVNVLPALVAGDVDVALMGSDNAFLAAGQGKPTPIVAELAQHNVYQFTARADLPLPNRKYGWPLDVRDLPKGAVIGVTSLAGANLTFAQAVLDGAGLKQGSDYSLVVIGQPAAMVAALKAKRIDAALLFMPYGNQAETSSAGTVLLDQARGDGPPDVQSVVCARAKQQELALLKTGTLTTLPACGQVAALDVVPKQPAAKRK